MKTVLIYPNFRWMKGFETRTLWNLHPYNICLLASTLRPEINATIIDANMENYTTDTFRSMIAAEQPDLIGISVMTNEYSHAGEIAAQIAKSVNPEITVVMGGCNTVFSYEKLIQSPFIDYVVIGEAERVLKELCLYLDGKGSMPSRGICYLNQGVLFSNGQTAFIENLDELPLPAYDLINFTKYTASSQRESVDRPRRLPYARILTSRGCPYHCCFCTSGLISGKKVRFRSPENIIHEIEFLISTYKIKSLLIDDDNLLMDKKRAASFFKQMIDKKFDITWNIMALAVFKLDEELLGLMKASGCQFINIAVESGSTRVLKEIIHKPVTLDHAVSMVALMKKMGIDVAANFVIGFPGETWSEIRQTLSFAEKLDSDYTKIFIATPFPHTELYRTAKAGGYLKENYDVNSHLWTDGAIETPEFRSKDLKILRAYEWDRINFTDPEKTRKIAAMMGVSKERLTEIRKETLKRANP